MTEKVQEFIESEIGTSDFGLMLIDQDVPSIWEMMEKYASKRLEERFKANEQGKTLHRLKTWPTHFQAIKEGRKKFEARKNDRMFRVGDELLLEEFIPKNYWDPEDPKCDEYSGCILHRKVTHISQDESFGIKSGFVVMSIEPI